jgi:hypothetical protein
VGSDDPKAVVRCRTRGEELQLETAWPDAPEPLIALCARALAESPGERYRSAQALRADLESYLGRATETSDAVLARLPELMEASFGSERERMQLFIGTRLDGMGDEAATTGMGAIEDELTPHPDEATAEIHAKTPLSEQEAPDASGSNGSRTGLRRAASEPPARRETGVHEKGARHSGAQSRPSGSAWSAQRLQGLAPRADEPRAIAPALCVASPSSFESSPPEATTAGHRAYSSNLDNTPPGRRNPFRLSPDLLGAAALLAGSLVAAYSVHRHSQRDKKPESQDLAIQAEARGAPPAPPSDPPLRATTAALPAAAPSAPAQGDSFAGPEREELAARGPAFFEGHPSSSTPPDVPPPLNPDDLPAVDPALRSLQDAIVSAARAQRLALEHKRARKADRALRRSPTARPADELDPSTEPGDP